MGKDLIITSVGSTKGTRQGNMFYIEFESSNIITTKDTVCLYYKDEEYYFDIVEVSTNGVENLKVKAMNVGYYNLFQEKNNFDIRLLLNREVFIIEDKETLAKIAKEKCYC